MDICRVIGNVVSTSKTEKLIGQKLMLVRAVNLDTMEPCGPSFVSVDTVQAGQGEVVLVVRGSSARQTPQTEGQPVDAVIVGVVDAIEMLGKTVFHT